LTENFLGFRALAAHGTHRIAEGTRGVDVNEHEIFGSMVIDASTVKTGR
jgi:hypothetical protein